ncbi:MAG: ABC transporter permease [Eubacteriales bacterium]|nr:ABC transporter permease [Eubacteriales bacterium]
MIENIRLAFQGIWSHKLRSFLTMLGIIIGIASIIAIVSTIKGATEQIKENVIGAGNNTVDIKLNDGDSEFTADYGEGKTTPILTKEIKDEVRELDNIENATFFYSRTSIEVYYQNRAFQGGSIYGIDDHYLDTKGYSVQSGRAFVPSDYSEFRKVALLDTNALENLFPGENAVGKTIEIGKEPFVIIGVVTQPEDFMPEISSYQEYIDAYQTVYGSILIPNASWPIIYNYDEPENAVIKTDSTDHMTSAGSAAAKVLNKAINNNKYQTNFEYKADNAMARVRSIQKLTNSTNMELLLIASISLLVGGIGVMNIMLVSVTERTSEIGLKKAIGARKKTILRQFLTEAAALTGIGGVIGVAAGVVLSKVVSRVAGTRTAISIPAAIIAVIFSTLIGVIFGLLPSIKAANLNPIDALRSE